MQGTIGRKKRVAVEIGGGGSVLSARALADDDEPNVVEVEYVPAEHLRAVEDALREIARADPVDLALDPNWPQRIAREALKRPADSTNLHGEAA
jgi:hypothetical protein